MLSIISNMYNAKIVTKTEPKTDGIFSVHFHKSNLALKNTKWVTKMHNIVARKVVFLIPKQ